MNREIERRFLIRNTPCALSPHCTEDIIQAYLTPPRHSPLVRVRIVNQSHAVLTLKWATLHGQIGHDEVEFDIPLERATFLLTHHRCGHIIEKQRLTYKLDATRCLQIDQFKGELSGLVIGEIEFQNEEDARQFRPDTHVLGNEITHDHRYSNLQLAQTPHENWPPFNIHSQTDPTLV